MIPSNTERRKIVKKIVCFGDSNTWGFNPLDGTRFEKGVRWPGILQELLGEDWEVIEEGQCGRTISLDDIWEGGTKNGIKYLSPMIESHSPMDWLIIMLGTNDMKERFHLGAGDIAGSLGTMIETAKSKFMNSGQNTNILILSPIHIGENIVTSCFGDVFDKKSVETSKEFAKLYAMIADRYGCQFLDAAEVAVPSKEDCVHMTPEEHRKLAEAIKEKITAF